MDDLPSVYYSNGMFIVFSRDCAMKLRRDRIVGVLSGCCPKNPNQISTSHLPYQLSKYAASIVLEKKLAFFKKLVQRHQISVQDNRDLHSNHLLMLKEMAERDRIEQRTKELQKRGIEPTVERIGHVKGTKLRITVDHEPHLYFSSFNVVTMSDSEVMSLLEVVNDDKMAVYRDLYQRGFYLSSGMKFGSDFLVYPGEPIRYHAQYAVRIVPGVDGKIDLKSVNFNEMNALSRLCHTAKKIPLFAIVYRPTETCEKRVKYWSPGQREYIEPDSVRSCLEPLSP